MTIIKSEQSVAADKLSSRAKLVKLLAEKKKKDKIKSNKILSRHQRALDNIELPLSFAQQRLWFIDQMEGGSVEYNMPRALSVVGKFNVEIAERALRRIIVRHESLRTVFIERNGEPFQMIRDEFDFRIVRHDLRNMEKEKQNSRMKFLVHEDMYRVFDLSQDLMLRTTYIHLQGSGENQQGILLFNIHHIASDGWSLGVLVNEFIEQYGALSQNKPDPAIPLTIQYADYALWQKERMNGKSFEKQLAYWKQQLADVPVLHGLPLDYSRPETRGNLGGVVSGDLSTELSQRINQLALENEVTPFMLLHAALALVLSRHSRSHDVVIGTAVANRMQTELNPLIGFFVNLLVLRVSTNYKGFSDYLRHVRQVNLEAQDNQSVPFDYLVEHCGVPRSNQHTPLFQIVFSMDTTEENTLSLPSLQFTQVNRFEATSRFDLDITATVSEGRIGISWVYDKLLFSPERVESLNEHLMCLLEEIADAPDANIRDLSMLSASEIHHLVHELNETSVAYPEDKLIHEIFEQQVSLNPENIAVVFNDNKLTYRALNERVNRLAHYLREQGIGAEILVGICINRSLDLIVGILAILKAGGAYVSIEPNYPTARKQYMLKDSGVKYLLSQTGLTTELELSKDITLIELDTAHLQKKIETFPLTNLSRTTDQEPTNLAYIIYTSGSAGMPKGVMLEHSGLVNLAVSQVRLFGLNKRSRVLQSASFGFDAAVWDWSMALSAGATLYIVQQHVRLSPKLLGEYAKRHQITYSFISPAMLQTLTIEDFSSVKTLAVGGESVSLALAQKWAEGRNFYNAYGPTENTVVATISQIKPTDKQLSIGSPIENVKCFVLDENLEIAPHGAYGELCISGKGLARGYLNNPELTQKYFIDNQYNNDQSARLYRTGDLVRYLSNGELEFAGRIDDQVKIRGFRIELGEIESLLQQNVDIEQAVVLVQESSGGDKSLAAYLLPTRNLLEAQDGTVQNESVDDWTQLFDDSYSQTKIESISSTSGEITLDITGWNCSYRDEQIPYSEMEEWVNGTIESIKEFKPKRVLEIGVGTGMLLYRYADECEYVVATDISSSALGKVREGVTQRGWNHIQLRQGDARELSEFIGGKFDVIVINSVIQYFPGANYLSKVIHDTLTCLVDGGKIFLGDLRNMDLLGAFSSSVAIFQAEENASVESIRQTSQTASQNETELLISPSFFSSLPEIEPCIDQVDIMVKDGVAMNEMMRYRYDVVLHKKTGKNTQVEQWHHWENTNQLKDLFTQKPKDCFGVTGFRNQRIHKDILADEDLRTNKDFDLPATKSEIRVADWDELANLKQLAAQFGYQMKATWGQDKLEHLDLIFIDNKVLRRPGVMAFQPYQQKQRTNAPQLRTISHQLVPQLKRQLEQRLPEFMLPRAYLLLEHFPLTNSGKIDKSALPKLTAIDTGNYVAAKSELEQKLQLIWQKVLDQPKVSTESNFFSIGGHSLLVVRLINEIRETLNIELSVKDLFEFATIKSLSERIEKSEEKTLLNKVLPPITARKRNQDIFESTLSFAQQRLWFIDRLEEGSSQYNTPIALLVKGSFDIDAAEQSVKRIILRHESLRTVFKERASGPVQVILNEFQFQLARYDLSGLEKEIQEQELQKLIAKDTSKIFDLCKDLMVRVSYIHLQGKGEKGEGVLLFNIHHIASDGWSIGVLVNEFVIQYQAIQQGKTDPIPPLAIQYVDYSQWQRDWLQGEVLESQLAYWKQQLDDVPVVHNLPLDFSRPDTKQHIGKMVGGRLSSEVTNRLRHVARENEVTIFMLIHAALAIVLSRHSNHHDIVIGTPVANRQQAELELLIGFFVNTLVLRVDTRYDTLTDYLTHIRKVNLDAQSHQDIPFEQLVEHLKVQRSTQHSPLFQILFTMDASEQGELDIPGLSFENLKSTDVVAKFDLEIGARESEAGLSFEWIYDVSLFTQAHIEKLHEHLNRLLTCIAEKPESKLFELSMLSTREIHHLTQQMNDTWADHPEDKCIHELFEAQVNKTPDNIAIWFEDKHLTYQALNESSNQLAHYLQERGLEAEDLVGICVERSLEMVIGILAILKAGGSYVPLDPGYPKARLEYMIKDSNIKHLLTQSDLTEKFSLSNDVQVVELDLKSFTMSLLDYPKTNPAKIRKLVKKPLAYVIYTSGSTGNPKGVMVEHSALVNFLMSMNDKFPSIFCYPSKLLAVTTISFDIASLEILGPISQGGQVVLASKADSLDPIRLIQLLEEHDIKGMQATPATWELLINANWSGKTDLVVLSGGETLPICLAKQLLARSHQLWNCYGPTEASVWSLVKAITVDDLSQDTLSLGGPLKNYSHYILNDKQQLLPFGSIGELYIGGAGLARGYLNQPELTAEKFVPNPFSDKADDRLYKTGDLVRYLPDGNLAFIGRIDEQVKIRGFRIELGEIENQLSACESVASCVVVVREDEVGQKSIIAYLAQVKSEDETKLVVELRDNLQNRLPSYMLPSAFVILDEFPLTPNGKIDKKALPAPEAVLLQDEYIAPESESESILVSIWAELLKLPADAISVTANFFELGGHSLLAVRLVSDIRIRLHQELAIKVIFESSTIRALAKLIDAGFNATLRSVVTPVERQPDEPVIASFAQQRLWFIDQLQEGSAEYNMPVALQVEGDFNLNAAEQAITQIVQRHETLRTVFRADGENLLQVIQPEFKFQLIRHDLTALDEKTQQAKIKSLMREDSMKVFDLSQDLMVRSTYLHLSTSGSSNQGILLFNMHHIASDGWSIAVLLLEFAFQYQAIIEGTSDPLPPLEIQYADYAHWQNHWLVGEVLDRQLNYWRKQLENVPAVHSLPLDYHRPEMKAHQGGVVTCRLDADLTHRLQQIAKTHRLTTFMLLHGALALVLSRHSNNKDIVIGTPVANRLQAELEPLIGFFANTLVLRANTNHDTIADYLAHIRTINLEAQSHQDIPFEQLVDHCNVPRSTQHTPLFQILFTMNTNGQNELTIPGVHFKPLDSNEVVTKFDLEISAQESKEGINFFWGYDTSLFTQVHIEMLGKHLTRLLNDLAENPESKLSDLSILSRQEIHHLTYEMNDTEANYPKDKCVQELFELQVARTPDAIAVACGTQRTSYGELNHRANQLAHHLIEQGIKPGVRVGIYAEHSLEMLVGFLGILKAGGCYVLLEPEFPSLRLKYLIEDSDIELILFQSGLNRAQCLTEMYIDATSGEATRRLNWLDLDGDWVRKAGDSMRDNPVISSSPLDLASVIYAPNDVSIPAGLSVNHESIVSLVSPGEGVGNSVSTNPENEKPIVQMSDSSTGLSCYEIWNTLVKGASLVFKQEKEPVELTAKTSIETYAPINQRLSNMTRYVMADNRLVPVGTIGELYLGGSSLPKDYLNKAPLTATRFVPNPFSEIPGERLYRTGNKVRYMSDGELAFVGRVKEQPRQRNFRIKTVEIEARLLEHPMVKEVVTLLPEQVQPVPLLVTYVIRESIANDEALVNEEALRQYLKQQSPDVLLPSVLMFLEQWPLTVDGEIDKSALPLPEGRSFQTEYVEPSTETERVLVSIWGELLDLETHSISITSNFFEIGGHSLLAVRILAKIKEELDVSIQVKDLFIYPDIKKLSDFIEVKLSQGDLPDEKAIKHMDEDTDVEFEI
ncbi:non-ribosomal peptide synthetase [Aliikangiella coralliicola]|nr:non-ribosomal peptide synthetase [Aliikangiella coralliicola]